MNLLKYTSIRNLALIALIAPTVACGGSAEDGGPQRSEEDLLAPDPEAPDVMERTPLSDEGADDVPAGEGDDNLPSSHDSAEDTPASEEGSGSSSSNNGAGSSDDTEGDGTTPDPNEEPVMGPNNGSMPDPGACDPPENCPFLVNCQCYGDAEAACAAAGCTDRCVILESYPAQVSCE